MDRIAFDTGVSGTFQGDLATIVARLEALIGARTSAVNTAMADFQADGVDAEYAHVETRWRGAADEVNAIIALVKKTMAENDTTAVDANSRARAAVAGIG